MRTSLVLGLNTFSSPSSILVSKKRRVQPIIAATSAKVRNCRSTASSFECFIKRNSFPNRIAFNAPLQIVVGGAPEHSSPDGNTTSRVDPSNVMIFIAVALCFSEAAGRSGRAFSSGAPLESSRIPLSFSSGNGSIKGSSGGRFVARAWLIALRSFLWVRAYSRLPASAALTVPTETMAFSAKFSWLQPKFSLARRKIAPTSAKRGLGKMIVSVSSEVARSLQEASPEFVG